MHGWQIHIYTFISILQGIYHTLTVNSSQSKGLLLQHACLSGAGLHRGDVSAVWTLAPLPSSLLATSLIFIFCTVLLQNEQLGNRHMCSTYSTFVNDELLDTVKLHSDQTCKSRAPSLRQPWGADLRLLRRYGYASPAPTPDHDMNHHRPQLPMTWTTTAPSSISASVRQTPSQHTSVHTAPCRRLQKSQPKCSVWLLADRGRSVMAMTTCGSRTGFNTRAWFEQPMFPCWSRCLYSPKRPKVLLCCVDHWKRKRSLPSPGVSLLFDYIPSTPHYII